MYAHGNDCYDLVFFLKRGKRNNRHRKLDCSAAAQNILLAAESMGLGAVWTAAYPYEDRMEVVRKYTHLPENILPLCVIPFGYPATKEQPKQKYDEKKIHYNQY